MCPFLGSASNVNAELKVENGTPCYADETGRAPGGTWHLPFLQVSALLGLPKFSSWLSASSLFLGSIPRSGKNLRLGWDYLDFENRRLCKERWEGQSGMKSIIEGGRSPWNVSKSLAGSGGEKTLCTLLVCLFVPPAHKLRNLPWSHAPHRWCLSFYKIMDRRA